MKLLQVFFISLAINLKPLGDGGYDMLGFSHKSESVAPAAFPAGAASSEQDLVLPLAPCA